MLIHFWTFSDPPTFMNSITYNTNLILLQLRANLPIFVARDHQLDPGPMGHLAQPGHQLK